MLASPSVSEFVSAHSDLRPKLVESREEAEEQPLPQNELLSPLQSSEIKDDFQPTVAETVKAEEAKAEEIKAEPEEDSEPPTKKAKFSMALLSGSNLKSKTISLWSQSLRTKVAGLGLRCLR